MKIGYITIQQANYGSVLQTFATSWILKKLGHEPILIDYLYPTEYHLKNRIGKEVTVEKRNFFYSVWKNLYKSSYRLMHGMPVTNGKYISWASKRVGVKYLEFENMLIKTAKSYDRESILANPPQFDIYMTGSDQTWNPRYYHRDYSFLLNFAPPDARRVAYAASFGTTEFYPEYAEDYGMYLKRYDAISVRESTGVRLVKQLADKNAVHCCDPTLLLTKNEWIEYAYKDRLVDEKYVLVYIQSYSMNPYPYADSLIDRVKKLIGAKKVVVITTEVFEFSKGHSAYLDAGPKEFLRLFADASFVVCCSFHSVAFSINFRKPFFAIANNKPTKDNRQSDILYTLGLEKRIKIIGDALPECLEEIQLDYTSVESKIEEYRSRSLEYLKTTLQ